MNLNVKEELQLLQDAFNDQMLQFTIEPLVNDLAGDNDQAENAVRNHVDIKVRHDGHQGSGYGD